MQPAKHVVVLPTYNEKENLERIVRAISDLRVERLRILVVDDHSPDGTGEIAEQLAEHFPVDVLHREGKLGLGSAYLRGFQEALVAGAQTVFEMDSDFSHDPKMIPVFLDAVEKGADVVIGSRRVPGGKVVGWSWERKLMSVGAMRFSRFLLGLKTHDVTSGYRCFRRMVLERLPWEKIKSNGYAFQEETIYWMEQMKFRIIEVPIIFRDREYGVSKLSKKEIIQFFAIMIRLRRG
ncbi:MAG: polyprenol monophosphomannose synthase [Patescibacteria group bacterium]